MNGGAVQMLYDGDGNRVAKSVNGVITCYLVDDLNPTGYPQVADELTNGVVMRTYTYGLQRISEDQIVSNTWTPSFYSFDGGGSVRAMTNTVPITINLPTCCNVMPPPWTGGVYSISSTPKACPLFSSSGAEDANLFTKVLLKSGQNPEFGVVVLDGN